jgi:hypothetical protein
MATQRECVRERDGADQYASRTAYSALLLHSGHARHNAATHRHRHFLQRICKTATNFRPTRAMLHDLDLCVEGLWRNFLTTHAWG